MGTLSTPITSITVYNSSYPFKPSTRSYTHEQLLSPPEVESLITLTASQDQLSFRLGLSLVIVDDKVFPCI